MTAPLDTSSDDAATDAATAPRPARDRGGRAWLARHPWVVPLGIVALTVALPLRGVFRAPGPPMEEGFMLVFPERVLAGDVPNRDFLHLYGPGSLWTLAGAFRVFGVSLWTERVVGLLQLVGLIAGTTWVGWRWGRRAAATGGVVTAVIIVPPIGVTALAWVGGVALGLWAVIAAVGALDRGARPSRSLTAAGLLAGASLLFRPDLVLALGLALGVLFFWALDGPGRRRLLLATAAGVSPYLLHLAMAGPVNAVRGMVLEPVFELRPGRRLPFPPPTDSLASFLNRAFVLHEFRWPLPAPTEPVQVFLWSVVLLAVCATLVGIAVWTMRAGSPHRWRLLALALFSVGLLPQALQRADTAHLAWVSCVPFGLLPAYLAEAARLRGSRVVLARAASLIPLALLLLFPHFTYRWYAYYVAQSAGFSRESWSIEHRGRGFYYGRHSVAVAAEELLADVERVTEPGQRLIVGTGDLRRTHYSEVYLYFLLPQLEPGTRYIEMDPGMANAEDSGLADELRRADVVILSTVYDDWDEPNASREPGSNEPNQVLAEDYCLVDTYGENGPDRPIYELHVRCDPPGSPA